jgi:hypothetical protein
MYVFDTNLKGITQSDLFRMREAGLKVQVFSIFAMNITAGYSFQFCEPGVGHPCLQ